MDEERLARAASIFQSAVEHPTTNNQRYNFACHEALRGRNEEAISFLRQAMEHGYRDPGMWILDDTDLASLHGDPEFEAIVEELKQRNEEEATATRVASGPAP